MTIAQDNPHAMTGQSACFGIDYGRGFYFTEIIGNIDAPVCAPAGSTIANVIDYPVGHSCHDLNGRYIVASLIRRD